MSLSLDLLIDIHIVPRYLIIFNNAFVETFFKTVIKPAMLHGAQTQASKKITERRMDRFGHIMRIYEEQILKKVLRTEIGPTREKEARTTENNMERHVPTRLEKY